MENRSLVSDVNQAPSTITSSDTLTLGLAASLPSPKEVDEYLARATYLAGKLKEIIDQQHLYTIINNKKHPHAEAWQTLAALDSAVLYTTNTQPVFSTEGEEKTKIVAYRARVTLEKHNEVIGAAEMDCGLDEYPCTGRLGWGKHRAAQSAAQTWAGAKACRVRYAWIMVMAGYSPTPAEEMTQPEQEERSARKRPSIRDPREATRPEGVRPPAGLDLQPGSFYTRARELGYTTEQAVTILGCSLGAWRTSGKTVSDAVDALEAYAEVHAPPGKA